MVNRLFCTALAVFSLLLAACGGGDEPTASQQVAAAPFEGTAVNRGTTFDGQPPRFRALSAPIQATTPTIDFRYTELNGVAPLQALAAAEAALAVDTITWDQLADYAERTYPDLFPGHQGSFPLPHEGVNYTVRYYPVLPDGRGNYIGVTPDGRVYGYGHFTGYTLTQFGDLATWTGPRLVSAKIVSDDGQSVGVGGGDVSYKGTKLVLGYDKPPNCTGVDGTRRVGTIIATTYCDASAKTITLVPGLPGEVRWPAGTRNVVTVSGIFGQDGLPGPSVTISFTTRAVAVTGVKAFVVNFDAHGSRGHAVSMVSGNNVTPVMLPPFPSAPNYGGQRRVAIDKVAGVAYVGGGGVSLFRLDLETGQVLTPINLRPYLPKATWDTWHNIQGLVVYDGEVCAALGRQDLPEYVYRNALTCFASFTLEQTFLSDKDYLAGPTMVVMDLVLVPERRAFYAPAATALAYHFISDAEGNLKQEFTAGSPGTVVEVNAMTKAVSGTFVVGAGPRSVAYDPLNKRLVVPNSGDITFSVINPEMKTVTKQSLPTFTGFQRPQHAVFVSGKLLISDYVGSVAVLDAVTWQESGRLAVGGFPVFFAEARGSLYVPNPRHNTVTMVNLSTGGRTVLPGEWAPWYVAVFDPLKP